MGIIVNKNNDKDSMLNDRITAELRNKANSSKGATTDHVEDSEYLKNFKKTGKFSWFWVSLVGLALVSLVLTVIL